MHAGRILYPVAPTPRNQAYARVLIVALSFAFTTSSPTPAATARATSPCLQNAAALEIAATWLAAYANQTRTLVGTALREPNGTQQKAYEAFTKHAQAFKGLMPSIADPQFAALLTQLTSAYAKGSRIDRFVVEYAESLGAFRSETQTHEGDPVDILPAHASKAMKALAAETLERAGAVRTALADLWRVLDSAKTELAGAKRGCRP